ncbi:hypothetical protein DICPUDRAFT_152708 [Dictyostelium purpureum]|uniref:RING-type domain-containing protein n=1 Tax=Dictyostelium purpureum TaxID=5786 RepID=F0ZM31_DICPU|nr:uncharacterized protein DICPUDRAFT_152708 [Dictyostelium purpureum]EGC35004.1 hypothetical protein DICPUDRAFT_152708 [Dictyostelium purpureum]|eukprot:XP_003288478.1 hypothetical protein DICPUDRAFT_152708 [Dictyostelium purpureum]
MNQLMIVFYILLAIIFSVYLINKYFAIKNNNNSNNNNNCNNNRNITNTQHYNKINYNLADRIHIHQSPQQFDSACSPPDQFDSTCAPPQQFDSICAPPDQFDTTCAPPQQLDSTCAPPQQFDSTCAPPQQLDSICAPPQQFDSICAPPQQSDSTCAPSHHQSESQFFNSISSQLINTPNPPLIPSTPSTIASKTSVSVYPFESESSNNSAGSSLSKRKTFRKPVSSTISAWEPTSTGNHPMKKRPLEQDNEINNGDRQISKKHKLEDEESLNIVKQIVEMEILKKEREREEKEKMERLKLIERIQREYREREEIERNQSLEIERQIKEGYERKRLERIQLEREQIEQSERSRLQRVQKDRERAVKIREREERERAREERQREERIREERERQREERIQRDIEEREQLQREQLQREQLERDNLESDRSESDDKCTICLNIININEMATIDCHHKFCYECIVKWSERINTCPNCRNEFYDITVKTKLLIKSLHSMFQFFNRLNYRKSTSSSKKQITSLSSCVLRSHVSH